MRQLVDAGDVLWEFYDPSLMKLSLLDSASGLRPLGLLAGFLVSLPVHATADVAAAPEAARAVGALTEIPEGALVFPGMKNEAMHFTFAGKWKSNPGAAPGKTVGLLPVRLGPTRIAVSPLDGLVHATPDVTWRQILRAVDKQGLSVGFAPEELDIAVGDAIAENVHGKNYAMGPVVRVLADFAAISPSGRAYRFQSQHPGIGDLVPGGYASGSGLFEVTLRLFKNEHVRRVTKMIPARDYPAYFLTGIRQNAEFPTFESQGTTSLGMRGALASNGVPIHEFLLYPPGYDWGRVITWRTTTAPLTISSRLYGAESDSRRWWIRALLWGVERWPLRDWFRRNVADPIFYHDEPITTCNYALSGGAGHLLESDPGFRGRSVVHQYFVPADEFEAFRVRMAKILKEQSVRVLNVSVQPVTGEQLTLLNWTRTRAVFAFVITAERTAPEGWVKPMVEASLQSGGTFDLGSHFRICSVDQIARGYPGLAEFLLRKLNSDQFNSVHSAFMDVVCPEQEWVKYDDFVEAQKERNRVTWDAYSRARDSAKAIHLYELSAVQSRGDIAERRELAKTLQDANETCRLAALYRCNPSALKGAFQERKVPDYLAEAFASLFIGMHTDNMPYFIEMRDIDGEFIQAVAEALALANDHWGHWHLDLSRKNVYFEDLDVQRRYQDARSRMYSASARSRQKDAARAK